MIRTRTILSLVAAATALILVIADAQARTGGGSSSGSRGSRTFSAPPTTNTAPNSAAPIQRSVTQPSRPTAPGAATQGAPSRPGLFGGGLLGGLAAGFIGAGLFGLLFGHGLFGGMGGLASVLGLILQIGLVVIVARLVYGWWQRRSQPAFAGPAMPPRHDFNPVGGGYAANAASEDVEIAESDFNDFERLLNEIQTAYSAEDVGALRAHATPEMVSYFSEELAANASRGVVDKISDVKLLQGDLAEAWSEDGRDYATVAMRFTLIDQFVDRASGRVVEGSPQPQEVTELWTFTRSRGGGWLLSAIQQA